MTSVQCPVCALDVEFTAALAVGSGWLAAHGVQHDSRTFTVCSGGGQYLHVTRAEWEAARLPLLAPETVLDAPVTAETGSEAIQVARTLLRTWLGSCDNLDSGGRQQVSAVARETRRFLKEGG